MVMSCWHKTTSSSSKSLGRIAGDYFFLSLIFCSSWKIFTQKRIRQGVTPLSIECRDCADPFVQNRQQEKKYKSRPIRYHKFGIGEGVGSHF